LVMFKIKVSKPEDSMEINKMASAYGAKIHDAKKESIMVEMTATPHQITAFEQLASKFGILQIARTGITALERSNH